MSVLLIGSSLVDDAADSAGRRSQPGGAADGRALAYLAHEHLGDVFGTHLRPQHDLDPVVRRRVGDGRPAEPRAALPAALRHGARVGARRRGRWSLLFTAITFLVTILFNADVDAQGGAYATGVLVLMTLGGGRGDAARCARSAPVRRLRLLITLVFVYTTRRSTSSSGRKASRSPSCVHRHDHRHVAGLARAALDRAARPRRRARRRSARRFIARRRGARPRPDHREPARRRRRREEYARQAAARRASRTTCRRTSRCCSSRSGPATPRSSATR